jgi:glycosyltransferase involved in cell wall biosynthesis
MRALISITCDESAIADHFRALARELAGRGHAVTMATWGKDVERHWAPEGVELVRYPSARPVRWADIRFSYGLMKSRRVDCVIANFGAENANAAAAWAAGVRVRVLWYHTLIAQIVKDRGGVDLRLLAHCARKRAVYGLATHVVGNSWAAMEELLRVWRLPRKKVAMFWNSIPDPLESGREGGRRERKRILCAGRLHPSKGQEVLLRALPRLAGWIPEVEVVFAGGGEERERLEGLARELGVEGRVRFAGAMARKDLLEAMGEAAVCVTPSWSEAFGLVNIEAMAMGTPVVASRVGGIAEVVRDGVDGWLFEPGNWEELAERLVLVLGDDGLREEMGQRARERFLEEFESSRAAKRQADWLEGLVGEKGG